MRVGLRELVVPDIFRRCPGAGGCLPVHDGLDQTRRKVRRRRPREAADFLDRVDRPCGSRRLDSGGRRHGATQRRLSAITPIDVYELTIWG